MAFPEVFNSRDPRYRSPFGAVRSGSQVCFRILVPSERRCERPRFCIRTDREAGASLLPMERTGGADGADEFSLTYTAGEPGVYRYWFDLYIDYTKIFRGAAGCGFYSAEPSGPLYQLTVYDRDFETPACLRGGVMYQIFPDRFCEGVPGRPMPFADRFYRADKTGEPYFWPNEMDDGLLNRDYFGGDFAGIEQKLPYLASLGVTVIYLNPIFTAHSNHRYNTADYLNPDPLLGTKEDFRRLCAAAQAAGIRIILDGVFSHTGSDSLYFDREGRYGSHGAYHDPNSPYRRWYFFGPQYKWGYRCWWDQQTLPEVNEEEPSYRRFICGEDGVIDSWMKLGASGFRLDVADELPDDFIEEIRTAVKRHGGDKLLLGEVWEDASDKVSYGRQRTYLLGRGLDSVMNYPLRGAVLEYLRGGSADDLAETAMTLAEHYPQPALDFCMNLLSTHDTVRAITALAGESCEGRDRYWQSGRVLGPAEYAKGLRLMRLAFCLTFTLPGLPCIYYGDEIGMQGYKDPFNRAFFDWNSREESLRNTIRELAAFRSRNPAFRAGSLTVETARDGLFVFRRGGGDGGGGARIAVNRSDSPVRAVIGGRQVLMPPVSYHLETI